ncbi:30S ribosomal protein S6 [Candidatus Beckwithbacteria bacterium RIFCSPLOWO2_02_FULL_47_23]|uniref:Small ribosomal subunit protein bS6 n=2 Tax=Candidatus Beckwithiibacteriota TaxID=1752726 RepID=A0A1F5DYP6_9BACT|nr:MAG: 30S ribosomal protein S6 [Candidatus Beckwithbacteria bacterium RIFCSPHIGHO2_12_FULL_47_17]OGD60190.1 MAG: 30S ribosomal protein S6 [Candidatus Beckwithbacteria bacterium RIFCSPLOWO2_02_FULL_47_23]
MSSYELTLVFREDTKDAQSQAKTLVAGIIKTTKVWGVRDLAYPIMGQKRGNYFHLELELEPNQVAPLDKTIRQNDAILRHLLISQA